MNKIDLIAKEFYAQYGFAMHNAHILETGLLELYALKKYVNENLTELQYYQILSNKEKLTLGQLNNRLFELNFLDSESKLKLITANKYRIFLAHRFWWEKEIEFDNHDSLVKLHKEIFLYINHFKSVMLPIDHLINEIRIVNNLNIEEKMDLTDFKEREKFIKNLKNTK